MKKALSLFLAIFSVALVSCVNGNENTLPITTLTNENNPTSVTTSQSDNLTSPTPIEAWDGSSSQRFEKGSGTASDPYCISTASQLAHLAQTVNSGTTYANKHFVLTSDLNLNHKEWTPIGNGKNSFKGVLDGNNHTIFNLKITKVVSWTNSSSGSSWGLAGLFGSCENASLSNFKIENASITISSANYDYVGIGTVIGRATSTSQLQVNNIRISKTSVKVEKSNSILYEGGCIGYMQVQQNGWCDIQTIQCDVTLSTKGENTNYLGGITGYFSNKGSSEVSNLACYSDTYLPHNSGNNYAGAFGAINSQQGSVELSNAFSEIKFNHELLSSNNCSYDANAIIGVVYQSKDTTGSFKCKNLFGYVQADRSAPIYSLYYIPINLLESNCVGCTSLPSNHNLSSAVWNVSSKSHPILK